ncbi:DUF6136 family protein [Pseudoalteromonas spongiae]|uniref:DUF6136 family protein n=1 Tax=Pseudoalteromonas spongiae TaxID=298657 RepID=UPI000C2CE907|nr:DUF6136 family protein [Pseudoalteromonas spongiae]
MRNFSFFEYRIAAFHHFIAEQLGQLKQLGVILALFMYTAFPALILLIYLALGKVMTQDPTLSILLSVALIVMQSELSVALSEGALDVKHRLYQRSFASKGMRVLCDYTLALAGNLVFLLSVPLLLSLDFSKWQQGLHFVLFCICVLGSGFVATLKPTRIKLYVITVILLPVLFDLSLLSLLTSYIALLVGVAFWPNSLAFKRLTKLNLGFWVSYHSHAFAEIWWRVLMLLALWVFANVLNLQRPDLGFFVHCFISPFIVYIASSQQLNQNECVIQYKLWLNSLRNANTLVYGQYVVPMSLAVVGLMSLQLIVVSFQSLIIFAIASALTIAFAKYKPAHYALGWFVINGLMVTISYWVY